MKISVTISEDRPSLIRKRVRRRTESGWEERRLVSLVSEREGGKNLKTRRAKEVDGGKRVCGKGFLGK